ncbi:hypothetical protein J7L67_06040 [bacterium]|nr:hypothetical protein [bacterium]
MPEPTPNKTAAKASEEQIVNRIVELLNERGYEYERDARPIICWKFGVKSSRELSVSQKKEVKESLENGQFEKWGMQYKEQVIDKQMDIVKEIEKLHGAPADIKVDPQRNVAIATDKQSQPDEPEEKIKKIKLQPKNDVDILKTKTDKPPEKTDKKLIGASNIKIDIPAEKAKQDKSETESTKSEIPKIDLKGTKISLKKSSAQPLDKQVSQQPEITETVGSAQKTSKPKTVSSIKKDTKVLKKSKEIKNETILNEPVTSDIPKDDKKTLAAEIKDSIVEHDKSLTRASQDTVVEDQPAPAAQGKRYRLTTRGSSENNIAMGLEEAKKIVRDKFAENSYNEEFSTASIALLFLSLSFLTLSIYTNYLIYLDENYPSWLVFVCEIFG